MQEKNYFFPSERHHLKHQSDSLHSTQTSDTELNKS